MVIRSLGVLSVGKIVGIVYACLGLFAGGLFSLLSIAGAGLSGVPGPASFLFGAAAIVFVPIFYGAVGCVAGILMALFFNLAAYLAGGLEVEVAGQ
jgi:hypothetical protein